MKKTFAHYREFENLTSPYMGVSIIRASVGFFTLYGKEIMAPNSLKSVGPSRFGLRQELLQAEVM